MSEFWKEITTIATAIIGLAIVAVLVSRNANTANIVSASTSGFAQTLSAATAPVTGGGGYSSSGFYGG